MCCGKIVVHKQGAQNKMLIKLLIGVQAIVRVILIPISIVTMALNLLSMYEMWKFQQVHGQAQTDVGVPRYRAISRDQIGLVQLQTAGLFSLSVAVCSLVSVSLMGYLHLKPLDRKGIILMFTFDSANASMTFMSWLWSTIAWPRSTCTASGSLTPPSVTRRGLLLSCKISAASVMSMSTQWALFTIALGISTFLAIVHLSKKKSWNPTNTPHDSTDAKD